MNLVFGFRAARISFSNKDCISSKEQKSARASQAGRAKSYPRTVHRLFTGPLVHTVPAIPRWTDDARAPTGEWNTRRLDRALQDRDQIEPASRPGWFWQGHRDSRAAA